MNLVTENSQVFFVFRFLVSYTKYLMVAEMSYTE